MAATACVLKRLFCCYGISLGFIVGAATGFAQTNRTWNGSADMNWFNPANWTPAGVPASNDIVTLASGTIDLTNPVTVYTQFNWSGGTLAGDALTVASNGVFNLNAASTLFLQCPLTNAGTVTWTNTGNLDVQFGGSYNGYIENQAGALWDIQSDQSLFDNALGGAYFHNAGTLRKSASTGTTMIWIPLYNSGSVTELQGTLSFAGGGTVTGTFAASTNAAIDFAAGNFTNSGPAAVFGPGAVQLTSSGNLTLPGDVISNLALVGGTVILGPGFQGGTITNLTIDGATLAGTNTVTGVFNWNNGTIDGPLTVATNASMWINGNTTLFLQSPLTNAGTIIWSNVGNLDLLNNGSYYSGLIENQAGALWDIQNNQSLFNNALGPAYFHNAGTLRKSASTGVTMISIPVNNSGTVTALQGTLSLGGGGILAGTFTASTMAAISFFSGNFTNSGPVSIVGPGAIQLTGSASLALLADVIPNLPLTSGTVTLGTNFQGGSITNLALAGATLIGTNTITGIFHLNNGTLIGPLTVASNGTMYFNGNTTIYVESPLTNFGTVIWTNTGNIDLLNSSTYAGVIENEPGALWDIQNDQSLFNNSLGPAYFHNAGTLQKSASTATTTISVAVTNSGTIAAMHGAIALNGGFDPTAGTLLFGLSSTSDFGAASIMGNANLGGTVGVVWLNGFVPSSGNSFAIVAYGSYSGIFTNINLPTAAMWQTNYGPNAFTVTVAGINQLAFSTQPPSDGLPNATLAPIVVQVEDYTGNPLATNGAPITLSLASGSGTLTGTLMRDTDPTGKATFDDLKIDVIGSKVLHAASPGLTAVNSVPFQIGPAIGVQFTSAGALLQLNADNDLGTITIYASTNFHSWIPIETNAPTNGMILFLDSAATNFPYRFYHVTEQ